MSKPSYDTLLKLLLIGNSSVGKTCLLVKYVDNSFNSTFISTIGIDFKIKTIEIDGKKIKLQIWDTAGQERFKTITVSYYRGAMGILIIYDISNKKSFDDVTSWLETIKSTESERSCVILVGNKCDLESREVSPSEGQDLATKNNVKFIETSAKTGNNVQNAFEILTKEILQRFPSQKDTRQPNIIETQPTNRSCC